MKRNVSLGCASIFVLSACGAVGTEVPDLESMKADLLGQIFGSPFTSKYTIESTKEFEDFRIIGEDKQDEVISYVVEMSLKKTGDNKRFELTKPINMIYRLSDGAWKLASVNSTGSLKRIEPTEDEKRMERMEQAKEAAIAARKKHASAVEKAKEELNRIFLALDLYRLDTGTYPTNQQGLNALLSKPGGASERWHGPYLRTTEARDPWGNLYQYRTTESTGSGYEVFSLGGDGKAGGHGEGEDIFKD